MINYRFISDKSTQLIRDSTNSALQWDKISDTRYTFHSDRSAVTSLYVPSSSLVMLSFHLEMIISVDPTSYPTENIRRFSLNLFWRMKKSRKSLLTSLPVWDCFSDS
ncbi:uncharacterized protein [Rhodnius prolixus]|uniref:uncharacterized protein n=1 Tax=Rhodnius prolixus TaxID=13249 RepID=UPI003D18EED4